MRVDITQAVNRWQLIQELEKAVEGRVNVEVKDGHIEVINLGDWEWSPEKYDLIRSTVNNHIIKSPRDIEAEIDDLKARVEKLEKPLTPP